MELTYELFKSTFYNCEQMPKNKEDFFKRIYFFYIEGRKNREAEIINKLKNFISQ